MVKKPVDQGIGDRIVLVRKHEFGSEAVDAWRWQTVLMRFLVRIATGDQFM